ncbi:MAG: hypothetical protein JRJ09_14600 [Deltaproteobacteria bacterium]|nr:hypothetical protein [Deltaproteobacteria bacterium]MBW2049739.1 hypothetical protein [Deltaproteobacteria bacterium]MBW2110821.1 hypothetical protein [Deltaproteobacteria bacterium]MBW2354414.1 hypothetical protein [Deltaproteobacteria bacterium]HDZ91166.1 hypothetical protein [Deltaproteobacteria bacterium]
MESILSPRVDNKNRTLVSEPAPEKKTSLIDPVPDNNTTQEKETQRKISRVSPEGLPFSFFSFMFLEKDVKLFRKLEVSPDDQITM